MTNLNASQFTLGRDEPRPCSVVLRLRSLCRRRNAHTPPLAIGKLRFCLLWRWRTRSRNIIRRHSTDDTPSLFGLHPCMSETRGVGALIRACAISTVNSCAIQGDNNIFAELSDRQRLQSVVHPDAPIRHGAVLV